jgi:hypothetical protein
MNFRSNTPKAACLPHLDLDSIDEGDEVSGNEQSVAVYCRLHRRYEQHWLPLDVIQSRGGH